MRNTSEGGLVVPERDLASLLATPPSVALSPANEIPVADETNESHPGGFVIGGRFGIDGGEHVNIELVFVDRDRFEREVIFGYGGSFVGDGDVTVVDIEIEDPCVDGDIENEECAVASANSRASWEDRPAGPTQVVPWLPGPSQIAVEVADKSTFGTLTVLIAVEEGVSSAEQLLDPYELMRRRLKDPMRWPFVGVAGSDWNFTALANRGEPVCALTVAIEAHHVDAILPLVDALALEDASDAVRGHAGAFALRCMNSVGVLDNKHVASFWAALALIGAGAKVPGGIQALAKMTANYVATPDEHAWRRVAPHSKIETTMLDSTRTTSALAAVFLAALPPDITFRALARLINDEPKAALEHRELALDNAPLMHLAIVGSRMDCLQALQESFQGDPEHWVQAQIAMDSQGRTAADLAEAMERREYAHNLRVNAAKYAAQSVLMLELGVSP